MPQEAPVLLALLALSATRALAAPMDMQVGILHIGGGPDAPSDAPTSHPMDPPSSPPTRPTDVMLEPSSPPTIQDSPAKPDSSLNADTTSNEPCTDCADSIPVSMSMPAPQPEQSMPVMIQQNILATSYLPTVTQQYLPTPSADEPQVTDAYVEDIPNETYDTAPTQDFTESTTLAVLVAVDPTSTVLPTETFIPVSGLSSSATGLTHVSSTFVRIAPGIVTHSAEVSEPSAGAPHRPTHDSTTAVTEEPIPTRYILSGILSSLIGLVIVFYFCAVFRRHRTKRREADNFKHGTESVLSRTLSYDKTKASMRSSFSTDSLHEKDNTATWRPDAPASARVSSGAWLRPAHHFPSLSVTSLRASFVKRSSVFSGLWSASTAASGPPRTRPTVYDRVIDISKNVPGSKFSVTSSDFGDCEKRGLKSLGEIPRPDEAFCRTPPVGSPLLGGVGSPMLGGMGEGEFGGEVYGGMQGDPYRAVPQGSPRISQPGSPMISQAGSPMISHDDASRPWTLYAESMESSDEAYRYVVPEEPRRDSDLPVITFSDYAEQKQRPVSLIRG
ncbi:uncharacterized protein SCHCODRAFT_02554917 [Schizophyllum commune H4-8]|nr:uncharacterized protein SCHCODRAFT_02554917 [Schizophyllum commune H4-8]KAI5887299.1 hypothetical protein SCHCODRAFT_02554917 [Schizophyllum commune H4-8]